MDKLKVIITNDQKAVKIPAGLRLMLRRCCTAVLRMEHFQGDAEVNITFTDDEKIREMNNQFRHIDAAPMCSPSPWAKTASTISTPIPAASSWEIS